MCTAFHFRSAKDINSDFIKAIVLTIEEEPDETAYLLASKNNKAILLKSIEQDKKKKHTKVTIAK